MKRGGDLSRSPDIDGRPSKRQRGATRYYGQFSLVEQLGATGDANAGQWLVDLDCFAAQWFDGLRGDLGDLPSWRTIAQQAGSLIVEFIQPEDDLLDMLEPALGAVAGAGELPTRWLRLELAVDPNRADGLIPVDVYLPPPDVTDPTLIAVHGQPAQGGRLLSVQPPGQAADKLTLLDTILDAEG
ncbi:hypothetical protein [Actinomadura rudentiformis]|uniref:Uncharacterized protein n=1 Tax=Actinomadura rudentiformis TaxID=359158 RepID=A0A6H9YVY5_9ACTN|nr:hypothetical protein [Actinomadura rudentiformis]KAB2347969.1 hypothetical protein F8566_19020 [Actinomadura rudentiformis]